MLYEERSFEIDTTRTQHTRLCIRRFSMVSQNNEPNINMHSVEYRLIGARLFPAFRRRVCPWYGERPCIYE